MGDVDILSLDGHVSSSGNARLFHSMYMSSLTVFSACYSAFSRLHFLSDRWSTTFCHVSLHYLHDPADGFLGPSRRDCLKWCTGDYPDDVMSFSFLNVEMTSPSASTVFPSRRFCSLAFLIWIR